MLIVEIFGHCFPGYFTLKDTTFGQQVRIVRQGLLVTMARVNGTGAHLLDKLFVEQLLGHRTCDQNAI